MTPSNHIQFKTIATTPWNRAEDIQDAYLDGWDYVREERVTARKIAVVFYKKILIPSKNSTDSDSM